MADIDIDRQLLVSAGKHEPSVALRVLWTLAVIAVAGAAALVGFKLGSNSAEFGPSVQTRINVNQIQQQLDDIQMRLDNLERHRRVVVVASARNLNRKPLWQIQQAQIACRAPNSRFLQPAP